MLQGPHVNGSVSSFVCSSERRHAVIDDALSLCSLSRDQFRWPDLQLRENEAIVLPYEEHRVDGSLVRLRVKDFDTLKSWVGHETRGRRSPHRMPSRRVLDPRKVSDAASLSRRQQMELEKAGNVYLYRDPSLVADYLPLLDRSFGGTEVAVIGLGRVTLPEGSLLELRLFPTVLMIEELVFEGGCLSIAAASRVHAGAMIKKEERVS
jgi:hypothetical protein